MFIPVSFVRGMNFSDMVELYHEGFPVPNSNDKLWISPNFYPELFQGVNLFWTSNGIIYILIIFACLHYRIFYTAS